MPMQQARSIDYQSPCFVFFATPFTPLRLPPDDDTAAARHFIFADISPGRPPRAIVCLRLAFDTTVCFAVFSSVDFEILLSLL